MRDINGWVESMPLTNMRGINGWVESICSSPKGEGHFLFMIIKVCEASFLLFRRYMKKTGFYIIKDSFFNEMNDPFLKGNKEGNRPHYYCLEDTDGIFWMIPLSSRIEKYKKIMDKKNEQGKPCDIVHIVKLDDDRESVFLIQDMFPITEKYIEREYTIAGNHLILTSEHSAKQIERKARKVMALLKRGVKFMPTQPDTNTILKKLHNS